MGVTITAKNSSYEFDTGYFGFFKLRTNIARALDSEFGAHYAELSRCHSREQFAIHDRIANEIIERKNLDGDIVNFLYQSDCDGKVSYKTCKKIYDVIKDVKFTGGFQYTSLRNNDHEHFKEFLMECYKKRRRMIWY